MDNEALHLMKYAQLVKYAKELGLTFNVNRPKKEKVLNAIETHFQEAEEHNRIHNEKVAKKKTKKSADDEPVKKRLTKKEKELIANKEAEEKKLDKEAPTVRVKRVKKVQTESEVAKSVRKEVKKTKKTQLIQQSPIEKVKTEKSIKVDKKIEETNNEKASKPIIKTRAKRTNKSSKVDKDVEKEMKSVKEKDEEKVVPKRAVKSSKATKKTTKKEQAANVEQANIKKLDTPAQDEPVNITCSKTPQITDKLQSKQIQNLIKEQQPLTPIEQIKQIRIDSLTKSIKKTKTPKKFNKAEELVDEKSNIVFTSHVITEKVITPEPIEKIAKKKLPEVETFSAMQVLEQILPQENPKANLQVENINSPIVTKKRTPVRRSLISTPKAQKESIMDSSLMTSDEDDEPVQKQARTRTTFTKKRLSSRLTRSINKSFSDSYNDHNITNDITNSTLNKSLPLNVDEDSKGTMNKEKSVNCNIFYKTIPAYNGSNSIEVKKVDKPIEQTTSQVSDQNIPVEVIKPKRAKIVRPTQLVAEIIKLDDKIKLPAKVDVEIKKFEVVQREAGPRIVKPTILGENEAIASKNHPKALQRKPSVSKKISPKKQLKEKVFKRIETSKANTTRTTVPDFKALHEKEAQKMASINDIIERKKERHDHLTSNLIKAFSPVPNRSKTPARATSVQNTKTPLEQRSKTPSRVSNAQNKQTPTQKVCKTPARATSVQNTKTPLQQRSKTPINNKTATKSPKPVSKVDSKHIPKPIFTTKKLESIDTGFPKTPDTRDRPTSIFGNKTPTSSKKPVQNSLLNSVTKKPMNFVFGTKSNVPSTTSLLATSSFNRRKSFDIGASLAKPLSYNTHIGKLKPIDFNAKSMFLKNQQQSVADSNSSVSSSSTAISSGMTPNKLASQRTSSIFVKKSTTLTNSTATYRDVLTSSSHVNQINKNDILKNSVRQHSKQVTEDFRQNESKIRTDQKDRRISQIRYKKTDENKIPFNK